MFNCEEIIFMNRVALLLFCKEGANLKFDTFIAKLKVLQEGGFEEQVEMVIEMVMVGRSEQKRFVEVEKLINFVMSSMP